MEVLIEKDGHAGYHQICSMLLADNYWIKSHSMLHLEQMMELIEELWRYDMEPKIGEPVVDEYVLGRRERVLSLRPLKGSTQHHSWRISQYWGMSANISTLPARFPRSVHQAKGKFFVCFVTCATIQLGVTSRTNAIEHFNITLRNLRPKLGQRNGCMYRCG